MRNRTAWLAAVAVACAPGMSAAAQAPGLPASQVAAFVGTWPLTMTNPEGARETVRVWVEDGAAKASVQAGRFPAIAASGMLKDGEMLILKLTRFENGRPIWAVVALTLDGDAMNMAQMLEHSQTIKRGSGKKSDEAR